MDRIPVEPPATWTFHDHDLLKGHASERRTRRVSLPWDDIRHHGMVLDLFKPAQSPAARVLRALGV